MYDRYYILSSFNSTLLHVGIVASLLFALDWSRPVTPEVPLVIKGSVITDDVPETPPLPLPEPDTETEPVVETPPEPEPEPDPEEQERIAAEERQRQEDLARERERAEREEAERQRELEAERERIAREEEAERQRQLEAERERQRREEAERRRREEAELERQRQEAERRRLEEIERQRLENERRRQEADEAARREQLARELAAEQDRLNAMNSGALERYMFALRRKIETNWVQPPTMTADASCEVSVRQLPGGEVVNVIVERCNGDEALRRSVENAVYKASPLPQPEDPSLFERNLRFLFEPTQ